TGGPNQYPSQTELEPRGAGTHCQKEASGTAPRQQQLPTISGGGDNAPYLVTGHYITQDAIISKTDFSRLGFRANVDAKPSDKFRVSANLTVNKSDANIAPSGIINSLLIMPPTATIYEPDGSYTLRNPFENIFANPIATINETLNKSTINRVLGTTYGEYSILKDLNLKVLLGADVNNRKEKYYIPATIYEGSNIGGSAKLGAGNYYSWLNENTL